MLTKEQLITLFSDVNRKLFLGEDIYERCKRNGSKIEKSELEKRLNFWKNDYKFTHIFKNCNFNDVIKICNFSANQPVDDILDNQCYIDIYKNINISDLEEANKCVICLDYNKSGEYPNRVSCGHYFHYSCLNEWIGRGNNTCPECRQPINMLLGFPLQSNQELFKTIQSIDKNFAVNYLKQMEMFMTKDEITAFKQLHKLDIKEESLKDRLLIFLILVFIYGLISKGTAYITKNIDSSYIPQTERRDQLIIANDNIYLNTFEDVILLPSGTYVGYQFIILALTIFGRVLRKLK